MDTRNYEEENNCGLHACDCREDNTCGCSFPNNMSDFDCACTSDKDDCGQFSIETISIKTPQSTISEDSVCYCSPKECECRVEHEEVDLG